MGNLTFESFSSTIKNIFEVYNSAEQEPYVLYCGRKWKRNMRIEMMAFSSSHHRRILSKIWLKKQKHIIKLKKLRK